MKANKTEVFDSYEDFLKRPDKSVNGVSMGVAINNSAYAEQNKSNTGCWNCQYCTDCNNCVNCVGCQSSSGCVDSENLKICMDCENCNFCEGCYGLYFCVGCEGLQGGFDLSYNSES